MASSEVFIAMLIGKLREVMLERVVFGRELQDQLSRLVEQLEQVLYGNSDGLGDEAGNGHLQQQCKIVMICAREAEDISDAILVESSMPPKSLKGHFVHTVGDLIRYRRRSKARKLIEKLVELSWHYTKMKGPLSLAEWGPLVSEESTESSRPEYQMKRPTTTTTIVSNYEKLSIIGREKDAKKLEDMLKSKTSFQRISVIGEEGIGKTALVRSVYDDPSIENLFPCRAWITISNGMSLRHILVELIKQSPAKELKDLDSFEDKKLGLLLCEYLTESRYLIVLDDLKDFQLDINCLLSYFPDNHNHIGSRVIMTSREVLSSLPKGDHSAPQLRLNKLDKENSCKLLQKTHWRHNEGVTDKILSKCNGSPMKLLLCRGLVVASDARSGTVTEWLDSLEEQDPSIQAVMSLSYRKLPHWVKPCLLYLCLFRRGAEISTRRIFQLWHAEGLARRNSPTAPDACLQELLNWNMVQLVKRREADSGQKTCLLGSWHDYLSKFSTGFQLLDTDGEDKHTLRRPSPTAVSPWISRCWGDDMSLPPQDAKTASRIRSYISFNTGKSGLRSREVKLLLKPLKGMRDSALLRVLDLEGVYKPTLPVQFGNLLPNLRYLGLRRTNLDFLPKSVMNLSKLETLDLKRTDVTKHPGWILSLKSLWHLYLNEVSFDEYNPTEKFASNIETLWGLSVGKGSRMLKALGKFKGLRELGLTCHSADVWEVTENISTLTMLDSLRLRSRDLLGQPDNLELGPHMKELLSLSKLYMIGRLDVSGAGLGCLPGKLRVLTLSMSELQYDPMSSLGQLQHLVRLSLLGRSYVGEIITFPASSFPSLQELQLWKLEKLREIRMEERSMKSLEKLEIRGCKQTRKIDGLENATKLKQVKLTELAKQFAKHLENRRKQLSLTWIITSKELFHEDEPCSSLDECPGWMRILSDIFSSVNHPRRTYLW